MPFATDREMLEKEVLMTFFRGSGPGGQHRNKVETGVRLFHPPSGITVSASEHRSQSRNRETAFERLTAKLVARNRKPKPRKPTKKPRSADRKRLEEKKQQGERKRARRPPEDP